MTTIELEELDSQLDNWRAAKKDLDSLNALIALSTAVGHSDAKWQPILNINYQVAYKKRIADTNYHQCQALNKEIYTLIHKDLPKYLKQAIENIKLRYDESIKI